jgi:hypothetical protein
MDTTLTVLFVAVLIIPVIWLCFSIKWRKKESQWPWRGQYGGRKK